MCGGPCRFLREPRATAEQLFAVLLQSLSEGVPLHAVMKRLAVQRTMAVLWAWKFMSEQQNRQSSQVTEG